MPKFILNGIIKLIPLLLILSVFEIFSLAILVPLIGTIVDPQKINDVAVLKWLYEFSSLNNVNLFVLTLFVVVLIVFVVKNISIYLITKFQANLIYGLISKLITQRFHELLNKPYAHHVNSDTSALLRSIVQMPFYYANGVLLPYASLISEFVVLSLILIGVLLFNPVLFLSISFFIAPLFLMYNRIYKKKLKFVSEESDSSNKKLNKYTLESIDGIRELTVFNKKKYYENLISESVKKYCDINGKFYVITYMAPKMVELFAILTVAIILAISVLLNYSLKEVAANLILYAIALYRVVPSLNKILLSINNIRANTFTIEYMMTEIDAEKVSASVDEKPESVLLFKNNLSLKNICFTYDLSKGSVLNNVSLNIKKGTTIGITGSSGSGKSTLLNIMLRLFEEDEGGIFVDDIKITKQNRNAWYNLVGYVPQNVILFDGTISENIAWSSSDSDIDFERVKELVSLCQLEEFVNSLSDGISTPIGDKGMKLSGGQRQRIAIARAMYHKPEVLIFDEATSALDTETEKLLTESINNLKDKNLTIIIVAHRLQTLKYCDNVYKLENGLLS